MSEKNATVDLATLVSLGFSELQAQDVIDALDGNPDVDQMVADGVWASAAEVLSDPASSSADLVAAGFSDVQASVIK